jgi:molecular chaperone HtpG
VERVINKGYDVLYMTDPADEFVVQILESYMDKKFKSVNDDDLGFEVENVGGENAEDDGALFDFVKEALDGRVSSVKLSQKLVSHPVCISTEGPITLEMEKYFNSIPAGDGQKVKAERVLELNGGHPVFAALKNAFETDREKAAGYAKILYDMALLIAGMPVEDPAAFSQEVWKLF